MSTPIAPAASAAPAQPATPTQPEGNPVKADARVEAHEAQPKTPATSEAPSEKYEIKVNGKVKQVTRDELIRLAQLSEAATERFETAAQKERKAQQIIERAKKNPIEALLDPDLGLSKEQVRDAMEKWYAREFIEPETLTAEQLELKRAKERLEAYEKAEKEKQQAEALAAQEKAAEEYAQHFQQQIMDAIDANKLPKTKSTARKIAQYMRQALNSGYEAPMELIVQKVKRDQRNEDAEINEYNYDQFVERFGEEMVNKLIAENLKRLRDKRAQAAGKSFAGRDPEPTRTGSSGRIPMEEVTRRLKAMRMGK